MKIQSVEVVKHESISGIASLPLRRGDKERVGSGIVLAFRDAARMRKHLKPSSIAIGQVLKYFAHKKYCPHLTAQEQSDLLALFQTGKELQATHDPFLFRKEFGPPPTAEVKKYLPGDSTRTAWPKRSLNKFWPMVSETGHKRPQEGF